MKYLFNENHVTINEMTTVCGTCYRVFNGNAWMPTSKTFKSLKSAMNYAKKMAYGIDK